MDVRQIRSPADCRHWLVRLDRAPAESPKELLALTQRVLEGSFDAVHSYAILEQIRTPVLHCAVEIFNTVRHLRLPYSHVVTRQIDDLDQIFSRVQQAYQRVNRLQRDERFDRGVIIAGASDDVAQIMPLARALQMQSSRIVARLKVRAVVDESIWSEFAALGAQMRETSFLDEPLPDIASDQRPPTARALFSYPLLLSLAACGELDAGQRDWADMLAQRWAHQVGFRVDAAIRRRDNPHGPSLRLGRDFRVRLDTHRLLDRFTRWRADRAGVSTRSEEHAGRENDGLTHRTLDHLELRWSASWRRTGLHPCIDGSAMIRFGLDPSARHRASLRVATNATESYSYGSDVDLTQVDDIKVASNDDVAMTELGIMAMAERIRCHHVDRSRVVLESSRRSPAPAIDSLAAFVLADDETAQLPTSAKIRLGRVCSVEHVLANNSEVSAHRIAVDTWVGTPQLVQVYADQHVGNHHAYLLAADADAGLGATLFVPCDAVASGAKVRLRRTAGNISVEIGQKVDGGAGYERFAIRLRGSARL